MATNYEKFFAEADADKSGYLSLAELTNMLRKKGYRDSDTKIRVTYL